MPMPEVARMNVMMRVVQKLLHSMSPANRLGFLQDGVDFRASRPTQCLGQDETRGPGQTQKSKPAGKVPSSVQVEHWQLADRKDPTTDFVRWTASSNEHQQDPGGYREPGPGAQGGTSHQPWPSDFWPQGSTRDVLVGLWSRNRVVVDV
jgi:hypothetical protein